METVLIINDIRSAHNVGSLLRTAECLGVSKVFFTGYSPFPNIPKDSRLPHIRNKITRQIHKTSLGAETLLQLAHTSDVLQLINSLKRQGFRLVGLEQAPDAVSLRAYNAPKKVALLIGREVEGIDPKLLAHMDDVVEIPMRGKKESLNVVQATAVCLYQFLGDQPPLAKQAL